MADLEDEKGAQNVGPDKPPRDNGDADQSAQHRPQHEAKSPDDDIEQPTANG